jgi:hypothetical protein
MRKTFALFTIFLFVFANIIRVDGQTIPPPSGSALNFIVISDHGRNGYFNQKEVANMMANVAMDYKVRFYVTGGDNFQISGVQSTQDPLWMSCFENIYTHPSSHYEWYPAFGNHDHGGNTQAQIDYSKISRRWKMPANYYTIVKSKEGTDIRLLILDTLPLISGLGGTVSDYDYTSPPFPVGNVGIMCAVPPIDTKFQAPEKMGPQSQKNIQLNDTLYSGVLWFEF